MVSRSSSPPVHVLVIASHDVEHVEASRDLVEILNKELAEEQKSAGAVPGAPDGWTVQVTLCSSVFHGEKERN